jgi:hypothetical protein
MTWREHWSSSEEIDGSIRRPVQVATASAVAECEYDIVPAAEAAESGWSMLSGGRSNVA